MMILPTFSPARVDGDQCVVDRKFHTGVCLYAEQLEHEIVVLAPELDSDTALMDFVQIPLAELPYRIETVRCDESHEVDPIDLPRVEMLARECDFVYGTGLGIERSAIRFGKPFIPIVEYNLPTQIQIARLPVSGFFRRATRTAKTIWRFLGEIHRLRKAHSIHCNGYPIYEQTSRIHQNCLLYLDSRMSADMVIDPSRLEARLASLEQGRRPRLIYSGRYEAMKGAANVIDVGLALLRMGVDFELDLYGKGELAGSMRETIRAAGALERIRVHDAIPYPDLVEITRGSDLFVCCHIQDDPSCSYLEAMGSGLTIAGYENRMWRALSRESKAGVATRMGAPEVCAKAIAKLLSEPKKIALHSRRAREFALEHCFEREFGKRVAALAPFCSRPS